MSASVSGTLGQNKGVSVAASFLGGFLMYIGARIGGGCNRYCKPLLFCRIRELFCLSGLPF